MCWRRYRNASTETRRPCANVARLPLVMVAVYTAKSATNSTCLSVKGRTRPGPRVSSPILPRAEEWSEHRQPYNKQPSWDSMIELHMDRPTPRRCWNLDAATQRNLSDQKCSHAAGCDANDHGLGCSLGEQAPTNSWRWA